MLPVKATQCMFSKLPLATKNKSPFGINEEWQGLKLSLLKSQDTIILPPCNFCICFNAIGGILRQSLWLLLLLILLVSQKSVSFKTSDNSHNIALPSFICSHLFNFFLFFLFFVFFNFFLSFLHFSELGCQFVQKKVAFFLSYLYFCAMFGYDGTHPNTHTHTHTQRSQRHTHTQKHQKHAWNKLNIRCWNKQIMVYG